MRFKRNGSLRTATSGAFTERRKCLRAAIGAKSAATLPSNSRRRMVVISGDHHAGIEFGDVEDALDEIADRRQGPIDLLDELLPMSVNSVSASAETSRRAAFSGCSRSWPAAVRNLLFDRLAISAASLASKISRLLASRRSLAASSSSGSLLDLAFKKDSGLKQSIGIGATFGDPFGAGDQRRSHLLEPSHTFGIARVDRAANRLRRPQPPKARRARPQVPSTMSLIAHLSSLASHALSSASI